MTDKDNISKPSIVLNSEEDKAMLDVLVEVYGSNGPVRKALDWFARTSTAAIQSQQCSLDVSSPQGQAAFFVLKGRAIGVSDVMKTASEELRRRQENNATAVIKNVIDAATGY